MLRTSGDLDSSTSSTAPTKCELAAEHVAELIGDHSEERAPLRVPRISTASAPVPAKGLNGAAIQELEDEEYVRRMNAMR